MLDNFIHKGTMMLSQLPIRSCPRGAFHCAKHHRLQRLDHSTGDTSAVDHAFVFLVLPWQVQGKPMLGCIWTSLNCMIGEYRIPTMSVSGLISVDGRNPAPMGCLPYQLVPDFFHQLYDVWPKKYLDILRKGSQWPTCLDLLQRLDTNATVVSFNVPWTEPWCFGGLPRWVLHGSSEFGCQTYSKKALRQIREFWSRLPEANSLPLKIGHPKGKFVFQPAVFRCQLLASGMLQGGYFFIAASDDPVAKSFWSECWVNFSTLFRWWFQFVFISSPILGKSSVSYGSKAPTSCQQDVSIWGII